MRIVVRLSRNKEVVDFNNQEKLNGYIHKCLGNNNEYHNKASDYAISMLMGGKVNKHKSGLDFINGAYFTISSPNSEFINKLIMGIVQNREFAYGMEFLTFQPIEEDIIDFNDNSVHVHHFVTLTPFVIRYQSDRYKNKSYLLLNDDNFSERVTQHTKNKLKRLYPDLNVDDFKVEIPNDRNHKTRKFNYKNSHIIGNLCHINVTATSEVARKLYSVGIGGLTGSGYGTLIKSENQNLYFKEILEN